MSGCNRNSYRAGECLPLLTPSGCRGHTADTSACTLCRVCPQYLHVTSELDYNIKNAIHTTISTRIIHLHGEVTKVRPENCFNDGDGFSEATVFDVGYDEVHVGDKAPNGHQLRPHIVWFGEAVPNIEKAIEKVSEADILLIVGTSLQVYPAAGLYHYASDDCMIYVIDPDEVPIRKDSRIVHIKDVATAGIQQLFDKFSK